MEMTTTSEQGRAVGEGKAQLLCETYIAVKPPMSKIISESYKAEIVDYTVFADEVLVKGTVDHTFYYLHPHGKKVVADQDNGSNNRDSTATGDEKTDEFKLLNGWGSLVDSSNGIIHFHQQIFEFTGTVAIKDVIATDIVTGSANVKNYDVFDATVIADNGLISGGKQTFKIDVALLATRS
jgi:hypothetical protein